MNCTRDGALLERVKTTTLRLLKYPLLPPFKITPLRSALLTYSDGFYCLLSDRATRVRCRHGVSFLIGYVIALLVFNVFMKYLD